MRLTSLNDVFEEQIADLLSAETQLVEALPEVAAAASSPELRDAITHHLEQTRGHVSRLRQVIEAEGITPPSEECKAMAGLISEGDEVVHADGDPIAKDAAIIAGAQRIEHYEIAAYGTARELAKQLDLSEAAALLGDTLKEESAADTTLTKIATGGLFASGVNQRASQAGR
jgi:ferritin-like metal-binding protein YciE